MDLSVIILTFNEENHIARSISSAKRLTDKIFIVDCFSADNTIEIAEKQGAVVYKNKWPGSQAKQFNWALDNLPIQTKWILRLDADEYLSSALIEEVTKRLILLPEDVSGVVLKLGRVFLGKKINWGATDIKLLRLFRYGQGRCEQRFMDEHIALSQGRTVEFNQYFFDHNLNDLGWWTQKHNAYAVREAIDLLNVEYGLVSLPGSKTGSDISEQAARKRSLKIRYVRMPLFIRSHLYFIYRYFIRLGFLDGKAGFLWHFLQGWWYRTLVDARIWEVKKACGNNRIKIIQYIKDNFGYEL